MSDGPLTSLLKLGEQLARKVTADAAGVLLALLLAVVGVVLIGTKNTLVAILVFVLAGLVVLAIVVMRLRGGTDRAPVPAVTSRSNSKKNVCLLLEGMRNEVAEVLDVSRGNVRANVFAPMGRVLRMVPGLVSNIEGAELELEITPGIGSTGRCYANRSPNVAVYDEGWHEYVLDRVEMAKLNPDLRWILSVPIPLGDRDEDLWVLNCDGLHDSPPPDRLEQGLSSVLTWSGVVTDVLSKGASQ